MSKNNVIDSLGRIDENMIHDVELLRRKRKRTAWVRWAAMAACLCLVLSIAIPVLHFKGGSDPVKHIAALEYNGKFYEVVNIPKILEKYGLSPEITADMVGEHLAYLKPDGGGYQCTPVETDMELFQYAPAPCQGVLVVFDGQSLSAALFCNFYQFDSNTSVELTELYRVYDIKWAGHIASITEMGKGNAGPIGTPVTDPDEISEFYDMTTALWSCGNDSFQKEMFGSYTDEEEQLAAHRAFASDCRELCIETTEGLRFFIDIYPSFNWIYGGGTQSWFKIDDQMHDWIEQNLNQ